MDETDLQNRLGSLYYGLISLALLPYCSMSIFIYDRQFYSKDSASRLYGAIPYYLGNLTLEMMLAAILGSIYATIIWFMVGKTEGDGSFQMYLLIFILHNIVAHQTVQFVAILAPNQDIGFIVGAGYTSIGNLLCGFLVSYPSLGKGIYWAQWGSFMKYSFQALAMNQFQGTEYENKYLFDLLELDRPSTIADNIYALLGFVGFLSISSTLGLKYLHREKR